jgi:hypothetical protein
MVDMILNCPACGLQHIDAPSEGWDNPPHRSHACLGCGEIWRPADFPTNGVATIETRGKADTWIGERAGNHRSVAVAVKRIMERKDNRIALLEADLAFYRKRRGELVIQRDALMADAKEVFDLVAHLHRQRDFSLKTFGPGLRTEGVVDHIKKELKEIQADPTDHEEWIDVIILGFDGLLRTGIDPVEAVAEIVAKQTKNEGRDWPDWRKADPNKAIEHDRSKDAPAVGCVDDEGGGP